jgi:hypothetical protein
MSGLGHFAPGLLAKSVEPKVPLWVYLAAGETNDLLYFAFTATGIEKPATTTMSFSEGVTYLAQGSIPWSHGFTMSVVWSAVIAGIGYLVWRDRRASALLGAVVFSHWAMDFLMHDNLPLFFNGSPSVGLGLENSGPGFLAITLFDLVFLALGVWMYLRARKKGSKGI